MEQLQTTFDKLLRETSTTFHRYMYNRINWDARMIGLMGPRGVARSIIPGISGTLSWNPLSCMYFRTASATECQYTEWLLAIRTFRRLSATRVLSFF